MKRILPILLLSCGTLCAKIGDNVFLSNSSPQQLEVNNRILANVNGKLISVVDVMKKMDILFYQQFPEYIDNIEARYQFYQFQWKRTLQDLIDKELILADAEENKLPISNGDVRQEMESLFGPNIIANLDRLDMSYEQAAEMLRGDILLRRMLYMRVNAKAMRVVTPQKIRSAYEAYAEENHRPEKWNYQVISFRAADPSVGAKVAKEARNLLTAAETSVGQLTQELNMIGAAERTKVNVSDDFTMTAKELNPAHLEVLQQLATGDFSAPVEQKSRDNSIVYRIFHLKEKDEGGAIPFKEMEKKLEDKLLNEAIDAESRKYLKKLREHYGVSENQLNEMVSEDFKPFVLK